MKYSGKIFWSMETMGIWNLISWWTQGFLYSIERDNFIGNKNIQPRNFYSLWIIGLFFCFGQLFLNIAFSFTGWLGNTLVFTKVFYNIVVVYHIIHQWQDGAYCNGKNDKYGNKKPQRFSSVVQIYYSKLVYALFLMNVID